MFDSFVPARGLESGHAQTIFAHFFRRPRPPALVRERWELADGDFVDVDRLPADPAAPHVLVLHGLEGSSQASYVLEVLAGAAARGWGALALNFRSCTGPNRLLRSYHAGDTGDAREVAARLRERVRGPLGAVGFSLGGNVLVKLLAETGDAAPVDAAVAVSAPLDLARCAEALDAPGLNAVYRVRFVWQLRQKAIAKARRHPSDAYDVRRATRTLSLREFDDAWTAPVHGFAGARGYYAAASTAARLGEVRRPLLLLTAADDPMIPSSAFPMAAARANPRVTPILTRHGGHVAFVGGSVRRPSFWAEATALDYLERSYGAAQ